MMKEIKERLNKWRDILCSQTGRFNIMKIIFPKPFYSQEAQSKSQQDFLDINQQADSNIDVFYLTFLCLKIAMNADYFGHVLILLLECKQDKKSLMPRITTSTCTLIYIMLVKKILVKRRNEMLFHILNSKCKLVKANELEYKVVKTILKKNKVEDSYYLMPRLKKLQS